jgi:hypothetical protein
MGEYFKDYFTQIFADWKRRWTQRKISVNQREKNSEKIVHAAYSKYQRKDVKKNIA